MTVEKKDGQQVSNSFHFTKVKSKTSWIWALPYCAVDVDDREVEPWYLSPAYTHSSIGSQSQLSIIMCPPFTRLTTTNLPGKNT